MKRYIGILAGLAVIAMQGCANPTREGRDPAYQAVMPAQPVSQQENNGSIYQAATGVSLFEDTKARRVGDILTVVLVEQTDAKKSGDTSINKSNETSIANPTILGQSVTINPMTGFPLAAGDWNLGFGMTSGNKFGGDYASNQSNQLSGNITLTVAQVLANGNLVVQGEKWIGINQGEEYIRVRGLVRPVDITPSNTILSTQIADAHISYGGTGATADANKVGWLARFFISPFWAF